ncbi:MAG: hypothetical protein AMXMBFR7_10000 [Planctomycetota bacterium]
MPAEHAVAQVAQAPAPPQAPAPAAPSGRPGTGGHPSMVDPPQQDIVRMRRRTTSQTGLGRRTPAAPSTRVVRSGRSASPAEGTPARRARPVRSEIRPLPAGGIGTPMARRSGEEKAATDPTMIYMIVGAVLLLFGIFLVGYALLFKKDAPPPRAPQEHTTAGGTERTGSSSAPAAAKTTSQPESRPAVPLGRQSSLADLPADQFPRLKIPKPISPPSIDGRLDDRSWSRAIPQRLRFADGRETRPLGDTEFWVLATEKFLYVAARLSEPEMAQIVKTPRKRDEGVWQDDCVEIFIIPGLDASKPKYQWVLSIAGSVMDGSGAGSEVKSEAWDIEAKFAIFEGKDYWTLEAALPIDGIPDAEKAPLWRFNLTRNRPAREGQSRPVENTSWANLQSPSNQTPARFGVVAVEALGGKLP